ncbi:unnamed protein product [Rotaria magnacalcarata]|uniref:Uncharacterized protein n=1 Tax=Rotaria magnacalcarata TaxID=392030 RepID=A0A816ALW3_9BILA|nr:unnamed protein product [Rotaria magnacalcarata]CAF2096510.1 unnamed protein product [Rotaria magnacalcarata]CAF4374351.1 unnamed protein product [Rotaria magnacalcarata]CAF4743811.1 unnamed protein product [Rotaria magnacalcarata]
MDSEQSISDDSDNTDSSNDNQHPLSQDMENGTLEEDQYASTSFASLTLSTTKNPLDLPYDRKCRQKIWNKLNQLNFSFRQKKNKTPNLREVYEFPPLVKQVIRCLHPSDIDEKDSLPKPDVIFTLDTS